MQAIAPDAFVEFKCRMADKAQYREAVKRRRDVLQDEIVQSLMDEGLLPAR